MTRDIKFEEAFWDAEYTGSQGFDILLAKMKDGQKMCKDVEEFCKQRAKIEDDYAKSLKKLARSMNGESESGTLREAWDQVREQVDSVGQEHAEAARHLSEQALRVSAYIEKHKATRKQNEEIMKNSIKRKADLFKRANEYKKTFDSKCAESERFDNHIETMKKNPGFHQTKDWEKQITKQVKLQQDAIKADGTYKETIQLLEESRIKWRQEMIDTCKEYERLEENRIGFLRNEMWVHLNLLSQTYVDNDEHNEKGRKALEKCNIDYDIISFIKEKRVGSSIPAPIDYDPYISIFTGKIRPIGGDHSNRPPQPLPSNPIKGPRI